MTIQILFSNDITFVSAINMILYLNRKMQFFKQNYRTIVNLTQIYNSH